MIDFLTGLVDCFYVAPLRKVLSRRTFRYLACGGINWVVSTAVYWVAFNVLFAKSNLDLGWSIVVSPYIAALGVSLPVSFALGFWMQKNISFRSSPLRDGVQLWRYFLAALVALVITYGLEKLFVEVWHIYPTVAFMVIYLITAATGFVIQKYFTFRGSE